MGVGKMDPHIPGAHKLGPIVSRLKVLASCQVIVVLLIAIVVVIANEAIAFLARSAVAQGDSVWILEPVIRLTTFEHAFPVSLGSVASFLTLDLFGPFVLLFAIQLKAPSMLVHRTVRLGYGLLTGGGLANGLERMFGGMVTDTFVFGPAHDPAAHAMVDFYNLADIAIHLGAALLLVGVALFFVGTLHTRAERAESA
jgi:lipoprotein signal peptidase